MGLCKYKNIFGEVNTGIHSYRIFNIAYMDVLVTVVAAYITSKLLKTPLLYTVIVFFLAGILMHRLFCVRTTVDKLLFPNAK